MGTGVRRLLEVGGVLCPAAGSYGVCAGFGSLFRVMGSGLGVVGLGWVMGSGLRVTGVWA